MVTLSTEAWLLRGISSIPGNLMLSESTIAFTATGTGSAWPWQLRTLGREMGESRLARVIDSGGRAAVFRWAIQDLNFWVPWYYFGGGIKIRRGRQVLKFSFGRQVGMGGLTNDPLEDLHQAATNFTQVGLMRGTGALWASALSAAAANARDAQAYG